MIKQFYTFLKYKIILLKTILFSDYHIYPKNMLSSLIRYHEVLLITEKDAKTFKFYS